MKLLLTTLFALLFSLTTFTANAKAPSLDSDFSTVLFDGDHVDMKKKKGEKEEKKEEEEEEPDCD
jgi:hypothetical protein